MALSTALSVVVVFGSLETASAAPPEPASNRDAPTVAFTQEPADTPVIGAKGSRAVFTKGWVTATVYFDRRETRDIATAEFLLSVCATLLKAPVIGWFLGAGCAIQGAAIVGQARRARSRGMCLKIKTTWPVNPATFTMWPDIYSGSRCTW